jgi:hypothetical protein
MATGVLLDPVYSGKALHALLTDMQAAPEQWQGKKVLFVHTGGLLVSEACCCCCCCFAPVAVDGRGAAAVKTDVCCTGAVAGQKGAVRAHRRLAGE